VGSDTTPRAGPPPAPDYGEGEDEGAEERRI